MKRFRLVRDRDISGVSGTGIVAEGAEFSDGTCVLRWLTEIYAMNIYKSVENLIYVHGHEGATRVEWIDS